MNDKRHDLERRKKEYKDKETKLLKDTEEQKKLDDVEKKLKTDEDRKIKLDVLEKDMKIREEQRKKERQETNTKVDEVLNRKPLFKVKEEIIKEMEQSELEKKKENLKRLRSMQKPIDL